MLKSRLQKLDGLTHVELKRNITKGYTRNTKRKIQKYSERSIWKTWKICK